MQKKLVSCKPSFVSLIIDNASSLAKVMCDPTQKKVYPTVVALSLNGSKSPFEVVINVDFFRFLSELPHLATVTFESIVLKIPEFHEETLKPQNKCTKIIFSNTPLTHLHLFKLIKQCSPRLMVIDCEDNQAARPGAAGQLVSLSTLSTPLTLQLSLILGSGFTLQQPHLIDSLEKLNIVLTDTIRPREDDFNTSTA